MKKILILGAGIYQVPLIKKAKEMGLYTCGQYSWELSGIFLCGQSGI